MVAQAKRTAYADGKACRFACYPTDATAAERPVIAPLLPAPAKKERSRKTDFRDVANAIRYLVRTGCGREMMPSDFPPWQTTGWFREFVRRLLFTTIHDIALMIDRERGGRAAWIKHLFADGAYDRGRLMGKVEFLNVVIAVFRRIDSEPGFRVCPVAGSSSAPSAG